MILLLQILLQTTTSFCDVWAGPHSAAGPDHFITPRAAAARQRWGLASVCAGAVLAILTMIMHCWKCQQENHNAFLSFNIPLGIEFQETEVLRVGGSVSCGVAADKRRPRTQLPRSAPRSFLWTLYMASEISDQ